MPQHVGVAADFPRAAVTSRRQKGPIERWRTRSDEPVTTLLMVGEDGGAHPADVLNADPGRGAAALAPPTPLADRHATHSTRGVWGTGDR
jgi:hypothetical protein